MISSMCIFMHIQIKIIVYNTTNWIQSTIVHCWQCGAFSEVFVSRLLTMPDNSVFTSEFLSSLPSGLEFCVDCMVGEGVRLNSVSIAGWREVNLTT